MADKSSIEWTESTWNCLTGCTPVSHGCTNCYAAHLSATRLKRDHRYKGLAVLNARGQGVFTGEVRMHEDKLLDPFKWRTPRRIFVNSMSDVFHPDVPFGFLDKMFAVMALCPQHTFQVLTKRPQRMAQYLNLIAEQGGSPANHLSPIMLELASLGQRWKEQTKINFPGWPLANVWLGTSIENQETADERIPHLLRCPAAVRFLSCEPLLGPIGIADFAAGIHWVIVGGESGPHARPMHPDWARSLRDQCQTAGVRFFFKQWGEWAPALDHHVDDIRATTWLLPSGDVAQYPFQDCAELMGRIGKHRAGRTLNGREWSEYPEVTP